MTRPLLLAAFALACGAVGASASAAETDVGGSRDPLGIERFPYSWIVGYERDDALRPREYVLGRVDRQRREIRVEQQVRPSAGLEWATYETPRGTEPRDVVEHYLARIGKAELFRCSGRDCGRSNDWANAIFGEAILYGPDSNQHYFAGEYGDALIALYVIERGNRRVYAHLRVLRPDSRVALSANEQLIERLAGEGVGMVENVVPGNDGRLDADALAVLAALGRELAIFQGQTVYVVCHLYGSEPADALLAAAASSARRAADALDSGDGPVLTPFGAGPLLPRAAGSLPRLELVLPHRLQR